MIKDEKGVIKLYVKGADNIIKKRLSHLQPFYSGTVEEYLDRFAVKGLRTLLIATKILTLEEYKKF